MSAADLPPLSERLAKVDADDAEAHVLWAQNLGRWTRLNHVRTVAPLAATVFLLLP